MKYTSYVISNFGSASVVFDDYPENLTTINNSNKCCLTCYFKEKKDAFLRNTVKKHCIINVILTEHKKPECNALHSYDDAYIDFTKVSVQSSLKCLVSEIRENKNLLVLFLYHADHNLKPLYFKSNKK